MTRKLGRRKPTKTGQSKLAIVDFLKDKKMRDSQEIFRHLDEAGIAGKQATRYRALKDAKAQGLITEPRYGYYTITDFGLSLLKLNRKFIAGGEVDEK